MISGHTETALQTVYETAATKKNVIEQNASVGRVRRLYSSPYILSSYFTMGRDMTPKNCLFAWGICVLGPLESITQTASRSFLQGCRLQASSFSLIGSSNFCGSNRK